MQFRGVSCRQTLSNYSIQQSVLRWKSLHQVRFSPGIKYKDNDLDLKPYYPQDVMNHSVALRMRMWMESAQARTVEMKTSSRTSYQNEIRAADSHTIRVNTRHTHTQCSFVFVLFFSPRGSVKLFMLFLSLLCLARS